MELPRERATDSRSRRKLLFTGGATLTTGLAGCLGVLEDGTTSESVSNGSDPTDSARELRQTLVDGDPYRMHQYDSTHVGTTTDGGPTSDVDTVWTFRDGTDDTYYEIGTPAVVDGTVYVAEGHSVGNESAETVVYALDGATGEIEWEQTYPGTNSFGATVVAEDAVVLGVGASVVALEADSGTERWRVDRDFVNRITVADGTVYAINTTYADPPTLVAIDLETGSERWTAALTDGPTYWPTPPAVAHGTVYQGGTALVALSSADGKRKWSRDLEGTITGSPTAVDDVLYVPVDDGTVAAVESDGTPRWKQPVESAGRTSGAESVTSPAVADGSLYVTNSWQLTALDADTGSLQWTSEIAGNGPPLVADGVVYVSGLETVEAYESADGTRLWRYQSEATSNSGVQVSPVVGGTVFFPSAGLHVLREMDDGP